jgi:hypothetical protein
MEWIVEGIGLVFIGAVVLLSTVVDRTSPVSAAVDWASFAVLCVLAIVSLATGFKIRFLPFKLCPVIFITSAVLIVIGIVI